MPSKKNNLFNDIDLDTVRRYVEINGGVGFPIDRYRFVIPQGDNILLLHTDDDNKKTIFSFKKCPTIR